MNEKEAEVAVVNFFLLWQLAEAHLFFQQFSTCLKIKKNK